MFRNYLKTFWKVARQNKLFTFLSLFGISLTIMFVMIFSMTVNKVMKGSGPEKNLEKILFASRLKAKSTVEGQNSSTQGPLSLSLCEDYLKKTKSAETVSVYSGGEWEFILNGKHYKKMSLQTDAEFWKIFEFKFIQGRPYSSEDVINKNTCVVISQSIRELLFGDEKEVIGKTIRYSHLNLTVQGVVEDPSPASQNLVPGIYFPYTLVKPSYNDPYSGNYKVAFKVKDKSQLSAVRQEVKETMDRLDAADEKLQLFLSGPNSQLESMLVGYEDPEENMDPMKKIWKYLFWGLGFLFVPAINLMALNFARIRERGEEIAVRKSFGANSGILRGQFIFENLMLTLTGGVIGLLLSFIVVAVLGKSLSIPVMSGATVPISFSFDLKVFGIALLSCLLFGLFSGVLPAIRMSAMKPVKYLKGGEI